MIASKPIPHGQIENYTTADIADSVNKRYQTDNQQTYNDATSSIQTQLDAKLSSTSWIDYSATSTIVGWSSFTVKELRYKIIDNICFIYFSLQGTSNSTSITFTVPFNNTNGFSAASALGYTSDNGVIRTTPGRFLLSNNSNLITVFPDTGTLAWTASGQKIIISQFSFKIN